MNKRYFLVLFFLKIALFSHASQKDNIKQEAEHSQQEKSELELRKKLLQENKAFLLKMISPGLDSVGLGADLSTLKAIKLTGHSDKKIISTVIFSPDSKYLISAADNINIWDLTNPDLSLIGSKKYPLPAGSAINSMAINYDNTLLFLGTGNGLYLLNLINNKLNRLVNSGETFATAFSKDCKLGLTGTTNKITLWDLNNLLNGKELFTYPIDGACAFDISWDNKYFVCAASHLIYLFSLAEENWQMHKKQSIGSVITSISICKGRTILTSSNGLGWLSDLKDLREVQNGRCFHPRRIICAKLSFDNKLIVAGIADSNNIGFWDRDYLYTRKLNHISEQFSKEILTIGISDNNRFIVTGGKDGELLLFDLNKIWLPNELNSNQLKLLIKISQTQKFDSQEFSEYISNLHKKFSVNLHVFDHIIFSIRKNVFLICLNKLTKIPHDIIMIIFVFFGEIEEYWGKILALHSSFAKDNQDKEFMQTIASNSTNQESPKSEISLVVDSQIPVSQETIVDLTSAPAMPAALENSICKRISSCVIL